MSPMIDLMPTLDFTSWMRHSPIRLSDKAHLYFDKQTLSPRCLVVLPVQGVNTPPQMSEAAEKVYQGMVQVLELDASEVIHLRLALADDLSAEINDKLKALIHLFQPQHVLLLSRKESLKIDDTYKTTFHPELLVKQPEYKKMAYRDLLTMKKQLEGQND